MNDDVSIAGATVKSQPVGDGESIKKSDSNKDKDVGTSKQQSTSLKLNGTNGENRWKNNDSQFSKVSKQKNEVNNANN